MMARSGEIVQSGRRGCRKECELRNRCPGDWRRRGRSHGGLRSEQARGERAMVLKGTPQRCGSTIMAPGAIAAVGDWRLPEDSRDIHFRDTVKGGSFMNEQRLVRAMVEESPDLILELERIGALWQREEEGETYSLRIDGGHSFARCPFLEDRTGREMVRTLFGELNKRNVRILSNVMVLRLINQDGRISGAVGLNLESCEPILIRSRAIILACGGAGNIYLNTSTPAGVTGDGYGLALTAGAALMDMEFVQFYPLGFLFPNSLRGAWLHCSTISTCATTRGSASWRNTIRIAWSCPPGTGWPGPSTPRSRRGGAARMAASLPT